MKITDLTPTLLIRFELEHTQERGRLIPLRKINYQDVRVGDIFVNTHQWADEWTAIQITGKNIKDTDAGRWPLGEELLTYDVYHITDDEVVLDVKGHNYSYEGLLKEKWHYVLSLSPPLPTLNYPEGLL